MCLQPGGGTCLSSVSRQRALCFRWVCVFQRRHGVQVLLLATGAAHASRCCSTCIAEACKDCRFEISMGASYHPWIPHLTPGYLRGTEHAKKNVQCRAELTCVDSWTLWQSHAIACRHAKVAGHATGLAPREFCVLSRRIHATHTLSLFTYLSILRPLGLSLKGSSGSSRARGDKPALCAIGHARGSIESQHLAFRAIINAECLFLGSGAAGCQRTWLNVGASEASVHRRSNTKAASSRYRPSSSVHPQ